MSKPNPLALYQSVEYLKAENAELKEALKIAADALSSIDIHEEYSGINGRRQWGSHTSTWLYPGSAIAYLSDAKAIEHALARLRAIGVKT